MRTNIVPRRTRIIGRGRELQALADAFDDGARLVTLTGPGGVGKTRLAQEHALLGDRWDEAFFCDLGSVTDLEGVCAAVADALELVLAGGRPEEQIGRAMTGRARTLVVLDNFEQVAGSAAGAVAHWIAARDGARVLVTSREPLHLREELVIAVEPLVPATDAAALLAERIGPAAAEHARDREALAAIAARLDGIPLALELAAPRVAMLGPREVLARLDRGLAVLGRGPRDTAARQRTMGRAVQWSWDLLDLEEQRALLHLALFRGGFSIVAAEAVLAEPDVLSRVESLRDKSLLRRATGDRDGATRLEVYGVVRAHLADRVEALGDDARRRHATFFAARGEELAAAVDGADAAQSVRELALERENLLAAVDWACGPGGDATLALRVALALARLTWIRGPLALQVRTMDLVLAGGERPGDDVLRARAFIARGNALRRLGDLARGRADLDRSLALAESISERGPELVGEALTERAALGIQEARLDVATADAARAIEVLSGVAQPARLAAAHAISANVLHHSGRLEAAVSSFEQALRLYREVANHRGEGVALTALAALRLEVGRNAEAIELARRASTLLQIGDRWQAYARSTLAQAWLDAGDLAAARTEYAAAGRLAFDAGDPYLAAVCRGYAGIADCFEGEMARGAEALGEAVEQLDWGMARSVLGGFWAAALASLGRVEQARELLDRAERDLTDGGGFLLLEAIHLHRGVLELAEARLAEQAPDPPRAEALRRRAAARVAAATLASGEDVPLTRRSVEVRLALALLERALGPGATPAAPPYLVHSAGSWVTTPAGVRFDLDARALQRRLLVALAERRLRAPGEALSLDELLGLAWPGERILPAAAKNRLYVAMSRLRALGLEGILESVGTGYRLDPAVPLRLVHDSGGAKR